MKFVFHIVYILIIAFLIFYSIHQKGYAEDCRSETLRLVQMAEEYRQFARSAELFSERFAAEARREANRAMEEANRAMLEAEMAQKLKDELKACKNK